MKRVLIVEDEAAHVVLIRHAFRFHHEIELSTADCLKQVHALVKDISFDLILCDLLLPDGQGASLLPKGDQAVRCPVVLMTGHGDESVAVDAMKAGALDYLVKTPDMFANIPHFVERWLRELTLISQRRETEDRLRQKEEELQHLSRLSTLGEMLASIAHEINQPLQAITSYAAACEAVLESNDASTEDPRAWVAIIREQATQCGEIIRNLRTFARRPECSRTDSDLNAIVLESIELLAPEAQRLRIQTHLEAGSPPPQFVGGRVQIQQVVVNLLRNAYEAMQECDEDRRVAIVRTAGHSQTVRFSVQDRGPGLSTREINRLFEPFYTTKAEGMGMGLAISRSIIEAHSGRLWPVSEKGKGTTFQFEIRK